MTEQPLGESVTPPKPAAEGSSDGAPAPEAAPANAAAPSSEVAPAQDAAPAAAPAAPPARPRPEYGEYAPEGWEWKPEGDALAESPAVAGTAGAAGVPNAPGASTAGSIQGVPHNLGAGSSRPTRKAASQQSSGAPYRAAPGQQAPPAANAAANTGAAAGFAGSAVKPPSMADRVVTILLLMVGAYGALQFALAMMGLESMFALMAEAPGVDELTTPGWLGMTGKIVGMAILVFYGLVLVFSIRRMRAKKLTFWVPLAAGVIAFIAVTVVIASAMFATPELLTIIGDPERSTQLLEYLQSFPTS